MPSTSYYVSIPFRQLPQGTTDNVHMHTGTASVATDFIELRVMTMNTDGVTPTVVTKRDVVMAFEAFKRRIIEDNMGGAPFPSS